MTCSRELDANDVNLPIPPKSTVEKWGIPGIYESSTHWFALLGYLEVAASKPTTPAMRSERCTAFPSAKVMVDALIPSPLDLSFERFLMSGLATKESFPELVWLITGGRQYWMVLLERMASVGMGHIVRSSWIMASNMQRRL